MAAKKKKVVDNLSYWDKRSIAAEKKVNDGAKEVEKVVIKSYRQAQSYLIQKVRNLFNRSRQRSGIDEAEAKELLNGLMPIDELVELKKLAKDIGNKELQKDAQKRLNALAFKERITRADDLKAKAYLVSKQIADVQLDKQTEFYIDTIHDSYHEAVAEEYIQRMEQSGVTFEIWNKNAFERSGHEFKELSTQYTKNILESHWHGSNYSKRLWGDTEALAKRLEELFTVESMTGMSEFEMARAIASEFDRSVGVARRLIRTEANYMANQAKLKAWQDRGVKYYMLVAVLDLRTSVICRGKDHKVYLVSEAVVNGADGTYPPFHPWCRTIAVIYLGPTTLNGKRKALDPISGKEMTINQMTSYDEWMNQLRKNYSDEEIDIQKRKIINSSKDSFNFKSLKNVIGKNNAPKTLDEYQNIKYNDVSKWEKLKDHYFVKSRLLDGSYGSTINLEKQAPHIKSTVKQGKSYFSDEVDIQALFDRYAGTGEMERFFSGARSNKERIMTENYIGFDGRTGKEVKGFKIHHSKNRTHIVPWEGEK